MAKRKKRTSKQKQNWQKQFTYEVIGLSMLALTCIALAKLGKVGTVLTQIFRFFSGEWYGVCLLGLFILSFYLMWKRQLPSFFTKRLIGIYLLFFAVLLLSHVQLFQLLSNQGEWKDTSIIRNTWELYWLQVSEGSVHRDLGGGMIGAISFAFCYVLFDSVGTQIIAFFLILISLIMITGKSMNQTIFQLVRKFFSFIEDTIQEVMSEIKGWQVSRKEKQREKRERRTAQESALAEEGQDVEGVNAVTDSSLLIEPIIEDFSTHIEEHPEDERSSEVKIVPQANSSNQNSDFEEPTAGRTEKPGFSTAVVENQSYELPSIELLKRPKKSNQATERSYISSNARKLEQTFESFGVKAKVLKVHLGPAVTKYEVHPAVGVKVSKIVNLSDDLALALAAKDIRIEAPIPGKSAIGIEVPNQEVAMVSLREVLESKNYQDHSSKLAVAFGRDISGEPVVGDLSKMPHLLVAGATGSGKSVCINGIITSILMKAKPHEVKMMMIDPKMVELNVYNGVPHLLTPVVTDAKKASQALKKVVSEMERRYELFSHSGTRNIEGYNEWVKRQNETSEAKQPEIPYVVVIVDELADLMMVASGDVEDAITRLAQMARAAGIHLIIATQRPSVDVITGVIKANIPSRIAFSVSSQTDSRTILDMGGAEKLLGRGDMLFLPAGSSKPARVQGAFLSDNEVEKLVDFVISQQKAQYQEEMIPTAPSEEDREEVTDDLYEEAVQLVLDMQTASVSMLQRRFRIGYTRAARLIDAMEDRGVVGPYEGSKPRSVLVNKLDEEASSS
ncbi:DNA translocase FtsK [Bacillus taeanensis]|uniref:Cell division protein FtsK n=1 Tax=Bacillus taeanensis TaxID=273032 RepID=A0A366Y0H9_9BACI|nr:DNA translocase FtsK [Bacillus taeanensis]RBW69903.1 cell division protein FtsK [Bacillus taeanensis]